MADKYTEAVHLTHAEMVQIQRRLIGDNDKELANKFQWYIDDPDWIYSPASSYSKGEWWKRR